VEDRRVKRHLVVWGREDRKGGRGEVGETEMCMYSDRRTGGVVRKNKKEGETKGGESEVGE